MKPSPPPWPEDEVIGTAARSVTVAINYLITDGPEGDFEYHINIGDGAASMGRGALDEPDVSITSSYETAARLGVGKPPHRWPS